MARTTAIGIQSFEKIRSGNCFYIDKTSFIQDWWESKDEVTLITRPRRFGKTLTMSMIEQFFSVAYADRGDLFEGLSIWQSAKYRKLQGTWPVISLSFARIKESTYISAHDKLCEIIRNLYNHFSFLKDSDRLTDTDRTYFDRILDTHVRDSDITSSLYQLSDYLCRYYGKKVIILLDEYDTPMQEAYVHGFWNELVEFIRSLFNSAFKANPYLERGLMTGITRISKESIFSDLNHLKVVTTTSNEYSTAFGFTEAEVFAALDEYGLGEKKEKVKYWYDGFTFGQSSDIYNPWSILNFLDTGRLDTYWANSSTNQLVSKLLQEGNRKLKISFERLLTGKSIKSSIDEQIIYGQLDGSEEAVWSLLLASGYLTVASWQRAEESIYGEDPLYELVITNFEVRQMFYRMVRRWFSPFKDDYGDFIQALLAGDLKAMNHYLNRVCLQCFSYFDTGAGPVGNEPERFYHGFILGLLAELCNQYTVTSNRESGFGRYDVVIEPFDQAKNAFILEFKVKDDEENSLEDTVQTALAQIEKRQYAADLLARGFTLQQIKKYGFAFEGKRAKIGTEYKPQ